MPSTPVWAIHFPYCSTMNVTQCAVATTFENHCNGDFSRPVCEFSHPTFTCAALWWKDELGWGEEGEQEIQRDQRSPPLSCGLVCVATTGLWLHVGYLRVCATLVINDTIGLKPFRLRSCWLQWRRMETGALRRSCGSYLPLNAVNHPDWAGKHVSPCCFRVCFICNQLIVRH